MKLSVLCVRFTGPAEGVHDAFAEHSLSDSSHRLETDCECCNTVKKAKQLAYAGAARRLLASCRAEMTRNLCFQSGNTRP